MRNLALARGPQVPAAPSDNGTVDDLTREFLLESQEGLDRMERGLTELESRPADAGLLAEIFRAVHTIKGTTGFLGFARLEALSHSGENLLGLLREGRLGATPEIVSGLLGLLDRLRVILRTIESSGNEGGGKEEDREMIAGLDALEREAAQAGLPAPEPAAPAAAPPAPHSPSPRKVSPRRKAAPASGEAGPPRETPAPSLATAEPSRPEASAGPTGADSTLRVEVELLNRMMNLVGELVLTRNQILQATGADARFAPLSRRLDMVTADLREAVMRARMQPVSHVFSRFPRLVRDLARGLGKYVRLELQGQQTELDKSLLEAIRDPLTHAIRNAIDHGIELPAARAQAGKPAEGLVRLRARHEGSHVIVEVEDDGAGIDVGRIRDKAVERGLIPSVRAEQMSERELLQLIFLPGFSTAAAVTSISGRGVGMDVVRTNVEKIGGKVEIDSLPGRGTTLCLRIPLTLAIIPAIIVRSCGQNFALPQSPLLELVHLHAAEISERIEWLGNAPLYRLRGRLLPLVFLDRLLQQPERSAAGGCDIAVLNADGRRFGLVVQGVADPEEIVVKPIAAVLRGIGFYAGATVLGNGEMALILHPGAIAQSLGMGLSAETGETEEHETQPGPEEFLLVETAGRRRALSLETVVRIERIARSAVEYVDSRPVLRFEKSLLPLDDAAQDLTATADAEAPTTVVVCRDGVRHVGITVSQVLDVAGGQALEVAGTGAVSPGVALLHDRVTEVVPLAGLTPLGESIAAEEPVPAEARP